MTEVSRRNFFGGAVATTGLAAGMATLSGCGVAGTGGGSAGGATQGRPGGGPLPEVWGGDHLYQWSPPADYQRNLTAGPAVIRLAGQTTPRLTNAEGQDWNAVFKGMHDQGWTAVETGSSGWLSRKFADSEVREIKDALSANDVVFYNIHCSGNIIAPGDEADYWQRHIIDTIHSAEEFGCKMILTHVGGMYPNRNWAHPQNWSKEAWERSVDALKRICRDTAGSNVQIAIEPVNTESLNNPWAQVRLRDDVDDPRICCGLDITNMVYAGNAFRMSEFIDLTFDLLEDQIHYVHAKDFVWNEMMPGLNWAMNGTGNMDYELFLARVSRLKDPEIYMLVEFLTENEEYAQAQRNIRNVANKVGVNIYGTQG